VVLSTNEFLSFFTTLCLQFGEPDNRHAGSHPYNLSSDT
jgi:hypothetical protein